MADSKDDQKQEVEIKFGMPKGRMMDNLLKLMSEAGVDVNVSGRGYRPTVNLPGYSVKLLKPQNILEMLHQGTRDVGFAGFDWVQNLGLGEEVHELLDTGLDPVKVVVAAPSTTVLEDAAKSGKTLRIASEYEKLTKDWIKQKGIKATFVRTFGATECFPPEDADLIVDNTATGSTLKANGLHIIDVVLTSSTRLYCNKDALKDEAKKQRLDELALLLKSVLTGRLHRIVEFNVSTEDKDALLEKLPSMRAPTIAQLSANKGYAVKIAVKRANLPQLLPNLKSWGATDILVIGVDQLI